MVDDDSFDGFLDDIQDSSKSVDAPKKKPKRSGGLFGKKKKEPKKKSSSIYDEDLDFSTPDDDDEYGVGGFDTKEDDNKPDDTKFTLQTLFEFRWWEILVLVVEVLLVVYLVLVLTKVVPLF